MSRVLPRELKIIVLYFLPYYQLKDTEIFRTYLQQSDLVELLLLDGVTLEQIRRLFLPITDRTLCLKKFNQIYVLRNHLPLHMRYDVAPIDLVIQQAFMDKSMVVLESIPSFTIELPAEREFIFYMNDLTWSKGLDYICTHYTGTLIFPSIFEVQLSPESEAIIRNRLLDHKDEQEKNYGYSAYLDISDKQDQAAAFGKLLKLSETQNITLNDIKSFKLSVDDNLFIGAYFDITGESYFSVLICLELVKVNLIKKFELYKIEEALKHTANTANVVFFDQLTAKYVADCQNMISYLEANIAPSLTRDRYLAKLETVLDVENRNIDYVITLPYMVRNMIRSGNAKQIKQAINGNFQIPEPGSVNSFVYYDIYNTIILLQEDLTPRWLEFFAHILYRDRLLFDYYDKLLQDPWISEESKKILIAQWGGNHKL